MVVTRFFSAEYLFRWISFEVCRSLYHFKIQVKFDIGIHPPIFGWVMVLFRLIFCYCVGISFRSIAGVHWFHRKFAEEYVIVKYRSSSILVIICKILAELSSFIDCCCVDTGFRSVTSEGVHWLHWKFAQGYIIVIYRSSSLLVIICTILAKLWPFFDFVFVVGMKYRVKKLFPANMFWKDALISFEFCKIVYHYSIDFKLHFGNHPQNFAQSLALYVLN